MGVGTALADVPAADRPPVVAKLGDKPELPKVEIPKSDKEDKAAKAAEEAERKKKERLARVVVLKWAGTDVDYQDATVRRNVKSRIDRPDAQFFPEVDLYQEGRKVRDRTVVPAMQPAAVPNQNLLRVMDAVNEVSGIPYNAWQPQDWGIKAGQLREMVELVWFADRVEAREPLFLLYAQIGRSAENQNEYIPPFYETIGANTVNYYYYLAATLAYQDPALLSKLTDQDLYASISSVVSMLQQGAFPTLKVDFEMEGENFDLEAFSKQYEVFFNGLPTEPDEEGQVDIFLGRTDIYLKRKDSGHGLSERLEVTKLEDKRYFVRDVARKKMGLDFIEALFEHPNECTPPLEDDILNYLAIYARIHEKAEIYVAVPKEGNPNKVYIWRYDRPTATLQLVRGSGEGFPVRFAVVAMGGVAYNSVTPSYELPEGQDLAAAAASGETEIDPTQGADLETAPAYVPFTFEFRGHYNRLMVAVGAEAGFNTGGEDGTTAWIENYFIPGYSESGDDVVVYAGDDKEVREDIEDGDEDRAPIYNQQTVNRDLYLSLGVVLGRDAGLGLGPRLAARVGWSNIPYALTTTLHVGWAVAMPGVQPPYDRVRPFIDVDLRGGAAWPFRSSLAHNSSLAVGPVFGITAGVGTTF